MKGNRVALLGVLLGLAGAGLLALFVAAGRSVPAASPATTAALIVSEALAPGMTAEEVAAKVREVQVPDTLVPERRVLDVAGLHNQRIVRPVGPGEVLTFDQFAPPGPQTGGLVVADGFEALTVEAEPAPGLEGYATPGSRVNIYATLGPDEAPVTQMILAQTEVLAVTPGTLTGESQEPPGTGLPEKIVLLLQVPTSDVPRVVHAAQEDDGGALWFTLPSPRDPGGAAAPVDLTDLTPTTTERTPTSEQAEEEER